MEQTNSTYLNAGMAGFLAKIFSKGGGLISVFLLIRILGPSDYGLYVSALVVYEMMKLLALLGLDKEIGYRIPRFNERDEIQRSTALFVKSIFYGVASSAVVTGLILTFLSSFVGHWLGTLSNWLIFMSPLLVFLVIKDLLAEWLISHHRVAEKHFFYTIIPRSLLLGGVVGFWWFDLSQGIWVILLIIGINAVPVLVWTLKEIGKRNLPELGTVKLNWNYSLQLLLNDFIQQSLWRVDVLFVYGFVGSTVAGGYKLAAQFARVGKLVDDLTTPVFRPKIGEFLEQGSIKKLISEYNVIRTISFNYSLWFGLILALGGSWVLNVFGPYEELFPSLLVLVFGYAVVVSFGNIGNILVMDGDSEWVLGSSLGGFLLNLVLNFLLIPVLGARGAALASACSLIVQNFSAWLGVYLVKTLNPLDYVALGLSILAFVAGASFGLVSFSHYSFIVWGLAPLLHLTLNYEKFQQLPDQLIQPS